MDEVDGDITIINIIIFTDSLSLLIIYGLLIWIVTGNHHWMDEMDGNITIIIKCIIIINYRSSIINF